MRKIIKIIAFSIVVIGLLTLANGMIIGDLTWVIAGFVMIFFPVLFKYASQKEKEEKTVFDLNENKDKFLLNLPKTIIRKKDVKLSLILTLFFALIAFVLSWNFLIKYLFSPTSISLENAISNGCIILDPRSGCNKNPDNIIVSYDVNSNGVVGDANDTLSNLLVKYNCTGDCIKKRCSCPGY
jgi:hypothetical protein